TGASVKSDRRHTMPEPGGPGEKRRVTRSPVWRPIPCREPVPANVCSYACVSIVSARSPWRLQTPPKPEECYPVWISECHLENGCSAVSVLIKEQGAPR